LPLVCGLLVVLIGLIYGQTLRHDFLEWDDSDYVRDNPRVSHGLSIDSMLWSLSDGPFHEWHPLAVWSHMLDCDLYGLWPGGHHLTSVLFHAAASVLLLLALLRMTGDFWPAAMVAALFAVHPLHVESVAWVAERRDVLSALFFMLALLAYAGYVRRPSLLRYATVAAMLALGLMAKTMLVTFPLLLLLLDYWPLERFGVATSANAAAKPSLPAGRSARWRLIAEKLPLLALAVGAAGIEMTMHAQGHDPLTLGQKTANALVSCVAYLGQFLYPAGLVAFYQHPGESLPTWKPVAALSLLAAISAAALLARRRCPYVLVGWLWYLIVLAPVLGLVRVGAHAQADRYTYLSQIGLTIAVAWGAAD
jgi:hypothetical protein